MKRKYSKDLLTNSKVRSLYSLVLSHLSKSGIWNKCLVFVAFVVEISLSIYVEQKRLIEKAEEEERLRKEKEEKRIKEEAEKQATVEKGAPDASQDVDSKETQDHVQENKNKVRISFCFIVAFLSTFNFADYSYLSLKIISSFSVTLNNGLKLGVRLLAC